MTVPRSAAGNIERASSADCCLSSSRRDRGSLRHQESRQALVMYAVFTACAWRDCSLRIYCSICWEHLAPRDVPFERVTMSCAFLQGGLHCAVYPMQLPMASPATCKAVILIDLLVFTLSTMGRKNPFADGVLHNLLCPLADFPTFLSIFAFL